MKFPLTYSLLLVSLFFSTQAISQMPESEVETGILVLGSANKETTETRIKVALRLYNSQPEFDYIVVSGGCGAHNSSICEASLMAELLEKAGVPENIIFKEEKSKSTVQNYCYSRQLRKPNGGKVIDAGDTLFVVSDHWHAMSVAARFSEYDGVNAKYFIEGNIRPRQKDKVDYTSIFDNGMTSDEFCNQRLWSVVKTSYSLASNRTANKPYYALVGDYIFQGDSNPADLQLMASFPPGLEDFADGKQEIDAAYYNESQKRIYLFHGDQYFSYRPEKKRKAKEHGFIKELFKNLPQPWSLGFFDAAFFNPEDQLVYLFKGNSIIGVSPKKGEIKTGPKEIVKWVSDWPFSWGRGDVDSAHYDHKEGKLILFRGKQFLKISLEGSPKVEADYPISLKLIKPENL